MCAQKGVERIEAEACPDNIHMLVSIPPHISASGSIFETSIQPMVILPLLISQNRAARRETVVLSPPTVMSPLL